MRPADVVVGGHLSRAWDVGAHVARRNERGHVRLSIGRVGARVRGGRAGERQCTEPGELDDVGDRGWAAGFRRGPSGYATRRPPTFFFRVLIVALPLQGRGGRYDNIDRGAWGSVNCIPKIMFGEGRVSLCLSPTGWAESESVKGRLG